MSIWVGGSNWTKTIVSSKKLLRDRAEQQTHYLANALRQGVHDMLPPALQSLDHETNGRASFRLANMYKAFQEFLKDSLLYKQPFEQDWLFEPLFFDDGRKAITPALLIIQAILYSHIEWHREHFHDLYSAQRAQKELQQDGIPEAWTNKVSGLIVHQNMFRTAVAQEGRLKELRVWDNPNLSDKTEDLARGLCNSIQDYWKWTDCNEKKTAVRATMVTSLCFERRNSTAPLSDETRKAVYTLGEQVLNCPSTSQDSHPITLVYFEYGRYFLSAPEVLDSIEKSFSAVIKEESLVGENGKVHLLWFSFPRVSSQQGIQALSTQKNLGNIEWRDEENLPKNLKFIKTLQFDVHKRKVEILEAALGINKATAEAIARQRAIWKKIGRAFEDLEKNDLHKDDITKGRYWPVPLVGKSLTGVPQDVSGAILFDADQPSSDTALGSGRTLDRISIPG